MKILLNETSIFCRKDPQMQYEEPAYLFFFARVVAFSQISAGFVRLSLELDHPERFRYVGLDQRAKLFFPNRAGVIPALGSASGWWQHWRVLPESERPPMRTYTVRRCTQASMQAQGIDIDIAVHGGAGVASEWLKRARVGDQLGFLGSNAAYPGLNLATGWNLKQHPQTREVFLFGDQSAFPAIANILSTLSSHIKAHVIVELEHEEDVDLLPKRSNLDVRVVIADRAHHGRELVRAVCEREEVWDVAVSPENIVVFSGEDERMMWEVPEQSSSNLSHYFWIAGENKAVKKIRRYALTERNVDRSVIAFMGYWAEGRSEN